MIGPKELDLIEAVATEKAREIARTEISRTLRRIGDDLTRAYVGGRFDGQPEADSMVAYLGEFFTDKANQM